MLEPPSESSRVVRVGVRVDLDDDRTAEVRAFEHDDLGVWEDTFAAVARGNEVFVNARFFAVYADRDEPSFGGCHAWHTLSTQRDVTDDLAELAADVYDDWTTELADERIAGRRVDRADYQPTDALIEVGRPLASRIEVSLAGPYGAHPAWRISLLDG